MKKLVSVLVILGSLNSLAKNSERVILTDSKTFDTEVSISTVRCSRVGYGYPELKINLAGLDGWTIFDHTNSHVGEFGEPCMTAGVCKIAPSQLDGLTIEDIIQGKPGLETITVHREVVERKTETKNSSGVESCLRILVENLKTSIRAINFVHTRSGAEQYFPIDVCRK